jgi:ribosomal protein S18 acetylase RimI-like enzyme/2-polyprenyl-3-methyl-5-hydroxy-6-metoxy-1,4-benzoquinol methylase
MSDSIVYKLNSASESEILQFLIRCDADFVPPLSSRVELNQYAKKVAHSSTRFEAWFADELIGLVALYCNDPESRVAYITSVSVQKDFTRIGIAEKLLQRSIEHSKSMQMYQICLEVTDSNLLAKRLYGRLGFIASKNYAKNTEMTLSLEESMPMNTARDYEAEINDSKDHKYAYSFDFDVMHPYMIQTFLPFFRPGSLLELGSYKGDFTQRFLEYFDDITCVEASKVATSDARRQLGARVQYVNDTFEKVSLPKMYDNIVLTHVLEHVDNPVSVLKRINNEWLAKDGRFFLVCPNANAPSRQIAVKMGLITHNSAVTQSEAEHGHRRTYTLDTLERDVVAAGLRVVHRSGIFFKALANFQWDRLLQTDIISKEYLDGCFMLGQQYPDLCSSIFLLCEQGDAK